MPDTKNFNGIRMLVKTEPVITQTEPKFWRIGALKEFNIAVLGQQEAGQAIQNVQRRLTIKARRSALA